MSAITQFEAERAELEAILQSGIFGRAPNLILFLQYICQKYFEGEAERIKEYNIAVEALGRPPDFDQKKDSIVRVEAHRLRKRLREYYESEGASHPIQIDLPPGQYTPVFIVQAGQKEEQPLTRAAAASADADAVAAAPPPVTTVAPVAPEPLVEVLAPRRRQWWSLALLLLAIAGAAFFWSRRDVSLTGSRDVPVATTLAALAPGQPVRINAGSDAPQYTDRFGRVWLSDRFFAGGGVFASQSPSIQRTPDPALYRAQRQGDFRYNIPLVPGVYELHLHFAESVYGEGNLAGGGESARVFSVFANDRPILSDFDAFSDAGPGNIAEEKVFKDIQPAADGYLHLHFATGRDIAFVNAIEVLPSRPGISLPVRIVAREHSVMDGRNQEWGADRYVSGGQLVVRRENVSGSPDSDLYHGERYGHFAYAIPVAKGRYTVRMRFAEQWFGPSRPGGGGVGSRVFHVFFNGLYLLKDFDIFKEGGGDYRPVERVFHHLEPNAQGKLTFTFEPVKNYACINAIEVLDEGGS